MADMYDKIKKRDRRESRKRDPWTVIFLVIAVLVLVAIIVAVFYWFYMDDLYYDYVSDLSNSTATINDVKIVPFEIDGDDSYLLKTSTAYSLYAKLTSSKQFRIADDYPDSGGIHINYPDGSSLNIWYTDIDVVSWTRDHGILVRYLNPDGEEFCYITDRVVYRDLVYFLTN